MSGRTAYVVITTVCSACVSDLDFDGDWWVCGHCNLTFDAREGEGAEGEPLDCGCKFDPREEGPHAADCDSLPPADCDVSWHDNHGRPDPEEPTG